MHLEFPVGVAFLAWPAGIVRDAEPCLGIELFEQVAAVFEQGFAQAQLDGFAVADAVALQILAGQSQEGGRFLALFLGEFSRLESFFLRSAAGVSSRVIASLRVTYSSVSVWKRR
jgi:hypothetical protein